MLVTLIGDVASTYFLLRELDLQLEIARRTLALNDETVAYFRNRLDGGVSNRLEVDRIVANRAQTAASIPEIERLRAYAENQLSFLLGRGPGPITRPALPLGEKPPPPVPPGLPTQLLERRPDVALAEQLLVAANADIGAAKALFFPTLSLTGFLGGVNGDLASFLGGGGAVWSLTPSLFQPIFNAGRLKQNVAVMQARFDAAVAEYRKAALNGYREVANALVTIQKLAEIRTQQEIGVEALTDAADLSRARYDSGLASYIEILTADQDLFTRQLLLAQTQGAELRARAELYRTLGGGWQNSPEGRQKAEGKGTRRSARPCRRDSGRSPGIPWRRAAIASHALLHDRATRLIASYLAASAACRAGGTSSASQSTWTPVASTVHRSTSREDAMKAKEDRETSFPPDDRPECDRGTGGLRSARVPDAQRRGRRRQRHDRLLPGRPARGHQRRPAGATGPQGQRLRGSATSSRRPKGR